MNNLRPAKAGPRGQEQLVGAKPAYEVINELRIDFCAALAESRSSVTESLSNLQNELVRRAIERQSELSGNPDFGALNSGDKFILGLLPEGSAAALIGRPLSVNSRGVRIRADSQSVTPYQDDIHSWLSTMRTAVLTSDAQVLNTSAGLAQHLMRHFKFPAAPERSGPSGALLIEIGSGQDLAGFRERMADQILPKLPLEGRTDAGLAFIDAGAMYFASRRRPELIPYSDQALTTVQKESTKRKNFADPVLPGARAEFEDRIWRTMNLALGRFEVGIGSEVFSPAQKKATDLEARYGIYIGGFEVPRSGADYREPFTLHELSLLDGLFSHTKNTLVVLCCSIHRANPSNSEMRKLAAVPEERADALKLGLLVSRLQRVITPHPADDEQEEPFETRLLSEQTEASTPPGQAIIRSPFHLDSIDFGALQTRPDLAARALLARCASSAWFRLDASNRERWTEILGIMDPATRAALGAFGYTAAALSRDVARVRFVRAVIEYQAAQNQSREPKLDGQTLAIVTQTLGIQSPHP